MRWPPHFDEQIIQQPSQFTRTEDTVPISRCAENKQAQLTTEVWTRSLRNDGLPLEASIFGGLGNQQLLNIHRDERKPRPRSARAYCGSTARGVEALPRKHDDQAWIERPVAVGKLAVSHLKGQRYRFGTKPRGIEWNDQPPPPCTRTGDVLHGWPCPSA